MIDLKKLEEKLDFVLSNETRESFENWLIEKRKKDMEKEIEYTTILACNNCKSEEVEWYNTRPGDKCNVCYSGVLTKKTTLFKNKDRKIEKTKKITKTKYRIKIITDGNGKKWYRPERRKYYDIKEWAFGIIANFIFYVINYWEHPVDIEYDNVLGYKTLLDAEAQIEIWKMDDLEKEKEKKSKKIIHQEIVKL